MSKKVLFIVIGSAQEIDQNTKQGLTEAMGREDAIVYTTLADPGHQELYYGLRESANKIVNDVANFDYVSLIPNGSVINKAAKEIFDYHQMDNEDGIRVTYLPFVLYNPEDLIVVLNKHIWNSAISMSPGILDIDLALKQIDSTIFGAFIPTDLCFNEEYYNKDLKYYQQFHLLNHLADGDNLVVGIPKILLTVTDWDFRNTDVSNEDKIAMFNLARANWSKEKAVETPAEA